MPQRFPSSLLIAAAVVFALGFAISIEESSVRRDGDRVEARYRDRAALGAGVITLGVAGLALALIGRVDRRRRALHGVAAAALLAGGGLHVARGLGAFWSPPAPPGLAFDEPPYVPPPPPADAAAPPLDELQHHCERDPARCPDFTAALDAACAKGEMLRCAQLSAMLLDSDPAQGRVLAARACDAGDSLGCANLAHYAMAGKGGAVDLPAAFAAGVASCRQGHQVGCENLSAALRRPELELEAGPRREALDLACREYIDKACETLADELLELAIAGTLDDAGHVTLRGTLLRLCQVANRVGCSHLATAAAQGLGGPTDPALAERARRRACRLGATKECHDGEAPRGALVAAWVDHFAASDGGDHLDRLDVLEDAWSPCAAAAPDGASADVKVTLPPDGVTTLDAQGDGAVVDCLAERYPWREDPTPPAAEVILTIDLQLHP